jgi:predicted permease
MTVVGVAPAGFRGTTLGVRPLVFVPIVMRSTLTTWFEGFDDRRSYWAYLFARLKPGLSIEEARAGLEPLYRGILSEVEAPLQVNMSEQTLAQFVSKPIPIRDGRRGQSGMDEDAQGPLVLLLGVTAVIVLIACANIANLLLARSAARAQEMAVRLSIGASRRQLLRQLLTESCLLAALGGVAALAVAGWTLASIGTLLPPDGATDLQLALDAEVAGFTLLLSLATGLLFGIFPALHNTRNELVTTLKDQAGQPSGARAAARFRNGLVTAQIALSMALLVSAGLFIRSLVNVSRVDLGIETENVVTFELSPVLSGYDDERSRALYERVEEDLAAQPGVSGVASASVAVFGGSSWGNSVMVEGFEAGPDTNRNTRLNRIAPGYFRTLRIPLVAGRDFTVFDTKQTAKVAIVNRAFAGKFGLGNDAVGRRMGRGGLDAELDLEIVGLVEDTLYNDVKGVAPPLLYVPHRQEEWVGFLTFYARSAVEPDALLRAIPPLVARIDPELPVERLKTLPRQVRENVFLDRMITILSSAFAGVATLLAAVGLYGVLAYTVAQRTREIGLRMALGADATRLRRMVLGQVGRMALVGGGVGLAAAVALGRLAGSLLYGIRGMPVGVVGAAVLGIAAVALAAGFVPAHRASRIDPMVALRDQ